MKRYPRQRRLPLTVLCIIHGVAVGAGFLSPFDPTEQNRTMALQAPMTQAGLNASSPGDAEGGFHLFVTGAPYHVLGVFQSHLHLFSTGRSRRLFLIGTDEFGRDLFSRILDGAQISLATAWVATLIALGAGVAFGVTAGFFGGWRDSLVSRTAELMLSLPWLYLLLGLRAFLPLSLSPAWTAMLIAAVIGAIGWARPAMLVRSVVLSVREREYVQAARGFGASSFHLMVRHCLPETSSVLAAQASLLIPQFILAEVTLSFVGLGIGEPAASWGTLLAPLRHISILTSAWWMMLPAVPIILTVWCCLMIEDSITKHMVVS